MRSTWKERQTQRLINKERKKRHIPPVKWDSSMHELARNHSEAMAKAGHLFHSNRFALQGGENCFMGSSSPTAIVKGWMSSHAGHREWLLDQRVKRAAVGISNKGHGRGHHTYVAWSFSGGTVISTPHIRIPRAICRTIRHPFRLAMRARSRTRFYPVRILLTLLAILTSLMALLGVFWYLSPTLTFRLLSLLPSSVQDAIFIDFILRGTGFWVFLIVSIILWVVRSRVKF